MGSQAGGFEQRSPSAFLYPSVAIEGQTDMDNIHEALLTMEEVRHILDEVFEVVAGGYSNLDENGQPLTSLSELKDLVLWATACVRAGIEI